MDNPSFENLRRFFERIKNVGFFERIFSWKSIVSLGYDAFGEFQRLLTHVQEKDADISGLALKNRELSQNMEYQQQQVTRLQKDLLTEQLKSQSLNEKITEKERERATIAEAQVNSEEHIIRLKGEMVTLAAKNEEPGAVPGGPDAQLSLYGLRVHRGPIRNGGQRRSNRTHRGHLPRSPLLR